MPGSTLDEEIAITLEYLDDKSERKGHHGHLLWAGMAEGRGVPKL